MSVSSDNLSRNTNSILRMIAPCVMGLKSRIKQYLSDGLQIKKINKLMLPKIFVPAA